MRFSKVTSEKLKEYKLLNLQKKMSENIPILELLPEDVETVVRDRNIVGYTNYIGELNGITYTKLGEVKKSETILYLGVPEPLKLQLLLDVERKIGIKNQTNTTMGIYLDEDLKKNEIEVICITTK